MYFSVSTLKLLMRNVRALLTQLLYEMVMEHA